MSREDILLDLYKLYAYNQNDAVDNPLTAFGNFCKGYEACEAEQSKRIADLYELGQSYARIADEKTKTIAELVEALNKIKSYEKDPMKTKLSGCLVFIAKQALASCLTKQKNV